MIGAAPIAATAITEYPQTPPPLAQREIVLRAGSLWQVTLEQNGVDAALFVSAPGEIGSARYNSRMGTIGRDFALLEPKVDGTYRITVEAALSAMPAGRVALHIEALEPARTSEQLLSAMRAESEGNRLVGGRKTGQLDQAIAAFARATDGYESSGSDTRAADTRFSLAALQRDTGDPVAALQAYRVAMQSFARDDAQARLGSAEFAAGAIESETGRYAEAETLLHSAVQRFIDQSHELEASQARNCLCLVWHRREQLERAGACYESVLGEFDTLGATRERALVLNNLGGVRFMQQRTLEAADIFAQALSLQQSFASGAQLLMFRNNVALAARRNGDYQRALGLYLENAAQARLGADLAELALATNNAGFAYLDLGELEQSAANFREALLIRERINDRAGTAATLNNLAMVLRLQGHPAEAATNHLLARTIATELELREPQAAARIGLGRLALDQGHAEEALAEFIAVIALLHQGEDRKKLDEALHGAGLAALQLNRVETAVAFLDEALALREQQAYPTARTETLYALAQTDARQGLLASADQRLDQAMQLVESTRADLLGPELRASYLAAEHGIFALKTELLMRRHTLQPGQGFDRQALAVNERARARSLLEQIALPLAALSPRADPELLHQERALQRQLSTLPLSPARAQQAQALSSRLGELRQEIRAADPLYASVLEPEPLDVPAMQAALGAQVTLLQFSLGNPHSYLWVVDEHSVHAFTLAPEQRINELAGQFVRASRVNNPGAQRRNEALAQQLGELLLAEAKPLLGNRRLVIVADGALHFIPFAALRDATDTALVQTNELVFAPSVSSVALQRSTRREPPRRMLAIVADPVLTIDDERTASLLAQEPLLLASATDGLRTAAAPATLQRLPASGLEANAIAALVPERERFVATGHAAQRSMILEGGLAPYRIVHFATHGVANSETPDASGLVLSRYSEHGEQQPSFLSVADLYQLRLSAQLVVLSACDTALGKEQRGEGLIGLTRGFMRAGAQQVLASAWQISDRVTAELMEDFYRRHLIDGTTVPAALREAQLAILGHRAHSSPYFWAAFKLNGDWL